MRSKTEPYHIKFLVNHVSMSIDDNSIICGIFSLVDVVRSYVQFIYVWSLDEEIKNKRKHEVDSSSFRSCGISSNRWDRWDIHPADW